jgi:putative flippase GtrA
VIAHQFAKFVVIGIFSTAVNYGTFYVLLVAADWNYLLASATGFVAGVGAGFPFNKSWTFGVGAEGRSPRVVIAYYLVYIASLGLSLAFLAVTVEWMGIPAKLANVAAIGLTTCTNFAGTKFLVFKR